ncbi:hypothetical protein PoB_003567600 [Plakobranchus ocellatus]|uniref:Uncharacterized protein n=1 Tax=Plakobranchus ocellatus TaxID=259542 RepID=A0AAV4ALU3_9GAST|nr:hypothetical protein PoB_003567600 [Plakobranchus ocellatus]
MTVIFRLPPARASDKSGLSSKTMIILSLSGRGWGHKDGVPARISTFRGWKNEQRKLKLDILYASEDLGSNYTSADKRGGVGDIVASESALRSAGTLLSRVPASPLAPWPESLRSPCCGLAVYKNQTKPTNVDTSQCRAFNVIGVMCECSTPGPSCPKWNIFSLNSSPRFYHRASQMAKCHHAPMRRGISGDARTA